MKTLAPSVLAAAVLATLAAASAPALALAQEAVVPAPASQALPASDEVVATARNAAQGADAVLAPPTAAAGLSPAAIVTWLARQGVTPGAVEADGDNSYVRVTDGPLNWILMFQSCQNGVCADLQFSIGFATAAVTPDLVNGWNRDRRFLKAFYEPSATAGEPASAVVQYDMFLRPGEGPEQIGDHLAVWRGLAPEFARLTTRSAAAN